MYQDLAGNEIKVGDFVVYSALWDRSAVLKYGRVTRLAERKEGSYNWETKKYEPVLTLRVKSVDRGFVSRGKYSWYLQKDGKEVTLGFTDRCLVIDANQVPEEARLLLEEQKETA